MKKLIDYIKSHHHKTDPQPHLLNLHFLSHTKQSQENQDCGDPAARGKLQGGSIRDGADAVAHCEVLDDDADGGPCELGRGACEQLGDGFEPADRREERWYRKEEDKRGREEYFGLFFKK